MIDALEISAHALPPTTIILAAAKKPKRISTKHTAPHPDPFNPLQGRRILIVEDEFFIAVQIEDTLQSFGCETIGPFATPELALQASRRERFDVAVLDINLSGRMVYPVADELLTRSIPFMFLTGYSHADLPEAYRSLPRLNKPFDPRAVKDLLERIVCGTA
jgi:CheY-like chemotaxis protein